MVGFLSFDGALAVVQVWCERDVAEGGEPLRHVLDVRHEPPPFLDHDNTGANVAGPGRRRQIARSGAGRGVELHGLAHRRPV